jgi:hypothetical protein
MITRWVGAAILLSGLIYLGWSSYSRYVSKTSQVALLKGIENYKMHQKGWPTAFSELKPYVDQSADISEMNPTFLPVSDNAAYVQANDLASLSPHRISALVTIDSHGNCSWQQRDNL